MKFIKGKDKCLLKGNQMGFTAINKIHYNQILEESTSPLDDPNWSALLKYKVNIKN